MTLFDKLTDEQRAAVEFEGQRLLLRAAAGSGKTRVLTARYLRHVIKDGISPDNILAITFTTKAATEMRRRIVDQLREAGLPEQAQIAETGPISTIHSFCERSLRENALAAGLDPDFGVMPTDQVTLLREQLLLEELAQQHHETPEIEIFIDRYAGQLTFNGGPQVHDVIARRVNTVLDALRGTTWTESELEKRYFSPETLAEAYRLAMRGEPKAQAKFEQQWQAAEREHNDLFKGLQATCGCVQLALIVWRRLEARLKRLYQIDYNLLESMMLELLERHTLTAERLRSQYQVVLVDEAQDLNPIQFRLLDALNPSQLMLVGDPQQSIYAFRNADSTQFIARQAHTPTLQLTTNFRSESAPLRMVDRVFAPLWAGGFAEMHARSDAGEGLAATWAFPDRDSVGLAELVRSVVEQNALGWDAPPRYGDIAILTRNKAMSQQYVAAMRRVGIPARHEGSKRFYARLTLRDVANTLEASAKPSSNFALLCSLHSPIGGLSLDSVIQLAIAAKTQDKWVSTLLSEFTCENEDDQAALDAFKTWFLPAMEQSDRIRAWELIGQIINHSPLALHLATLSDAPLEFANLNKLLMMSVGMPTATPIEFADQIRKVVMLRHEEEDADWSGDSEESVTLMNIHQSKGLEFPIVIIPSVHDNMRKIFGTSGLVHRDLGLVMMGTKGESEATKWLWDQVVKLNEQEELRVLYVAMTRAEKALLVGVSSKQGSWGQLVGKAFNHPAVGDGLRPV